LHKQILDILKSFIIHKSRLF